MSRTLMIRCVAALGSAAVVLVVGVGCASGGGQVVGASTGSAVAGGGRMAGVGVFGCGDRIGGLPGSVRGVVVAGEFPSRVVRGGGDGTFAGTVTVTSTGPRLSGVTSREADVYLARAGRVVATPVAKDLIGEPFDLGPDASRVFVARGAIRPCVASGGGLLPAGRYEVFAVVVVNRGDGSRVMAVGGPWPLEVT